MKVELIYIGRNGKLQSLALVLSCMLTSLFRQDGHEISNHLLRLTWNDRITSNRTELHICSQCQRSHSRNLRVCLRDISLSLSPLRAVIEIDVTSDTVSSSVLVHYRINVQCIKQFILCLSWFERSYSPTSPIPPTRPPFFLTSAGTGCTSPPCTSTVFGWGIFHKSLCCCRSLRKSSSAWRPCSSSAFVSVYRASKQTRGAAERDVERSEWKHSPSLSYFTSSSRGSEESEVLWRVTPHLHQRTWSAHKLSNDDQLFSEVQPTHPTPGLPSDGERL